MELRGISHHSKISAGHQGDPLLQSYIQRRRSTVCAESVNREGGVIQVRWESPRVEIQDKQFFQGDVEAVWIPAYSLDVALYE